MVQPIKDWPACYHLLHWNCPYTFDDFSVLCHDGKKNLLEFERSILIMRDNPSMKSKHCSPV